LSTPRARRRPRVAVTLPFRRWPDPDARAEAARAVDASVDTLFFQARQTIRLIFIFTPLFLRAAPFTRARARARSECGAAILPASFRFIFAFAMTIRSPGFSADALFSARFLLLIFRALLLLSFVFSSVLRAIYAHS
jgi:hypothetical protein